METSSGEPCEKGLKAAHVYACIRMMSSAVERWSGHSNNRKFRAFSD
jgi:hypothetical protein